MNKFCTKCGAPLREGARFCAACGAPAPAAAPPAASAPAGNARTCPVCGKTLEGTLRFCTGCGAPLPPPAAPAAAPSQPAAPAPAAALSGLKTTMQIPREQEAPAIPVPRPMAQQTPEPPAAEQPRHPVQQTAEFPAVEESRPTAQQTPWTPASVEDGVPLVQSHDVHTAPTPSPAQLHRQPGEPAASVPNDRQRICPGCGSLVEPGKRFCTRCGTRLEEQTAAPEATQTAVYPGVVPTASAASSRHAADDRSMAQTAAARSETADTKKRRTGLVIGILAAVLVLAAAAVLLIFREQIFGGRDDRDDRDGSSQSGETLPEPTEPDASAKPSAPEPTEPDDPVEHTAPVHTEPAVPDLTEDEAREHLVDAYDFPFDARLIREDADSYLFNLYQVGTDRQLGAVRVDKKSGALTEEKPVSEPELSRVGEVDPARVKGIMDASAAGAAYSFALIDLETGDTTGSANREDPMSSSVLIGIPVMYAVNERIESGMLSMSDLLSVTAAEGGRGSLYGREEMTVRELLQAMLQSSSGDAINTLLDALGMAYVEEVCHEAGFDSVKVAAPIGKTVDYSENDNYVSAFDLCGILYALYHSDSPVNRIFLEENYGIRGSLANDGLGKSLDGVVGSFNGVKKEKFNELLLVEHDGKAYAVAVMGNGAAYETLLKAYDAVGQYVDGIMKE